MPFVTCPQCKQSYAIDATNIGEESECECPCGNKFKVRLKAKPDPKTIPLTNSNSTISTTAVFCRIFAFVVIVLGLVTTLGVFNLTMGDENVTLGFFLAIVCVSAASLPLFALAAIIEELVKIRQGIGKLTESLSNNGKQS